jgi:hypothetical protein
VDIHPAKYLLDRYLDIWLNGWFIPIENYITALTLVRLIRKIFIRKYNVSTLLDVARQGYSGLAQTRMSTTQAFHWLSPHVCGCLATFNRVDTLYNPRLGY